MKYKGLFLNTSFPIRKEDEEGKEGGRWEEKERVRRKEQRGCKSEKGRER